ncbi:Glycosyltransferase family 92 protein [Heracleum sosnowskyi]|uniref:Glycosyltransferase family 92 protein n=1 Tax=Heracleum sosnowskyi TaxID=360622 RepID=A0AAD8HN67_9APIA|nr:Glycosyltransferase family 92 protein [Heracleum sosnowskyi]
MFIGVVWNCAAELKLLLTALLFLTSLLTIFQFLPSQLSFSSFCISPGKVGPTNPLLTTTSIAGIIPPENGKTDGDPLLLTKNPLNITDILADPSPPVNQDEKLPTGVIKRRFNTYGTAAYNFILMSAYRGGLNTFAINGLSSKPLHVFGKPSYTCEWVPHGNSGEPIKVSGEKILPDWGYGRVYTVVIINCTFPTPVYKTGGKLLLHAVANGGGDTEFNVTDTFVALTETPNSLNPAIFTDPPKYDYFYCGSSLYGNLSPQRVREWLAYHIRMFGENSHFVIHDAGGVHPEVMEVLKPWIEKGYKFMAKWMFFFDVDEFLFVPKKSTLKSVMDSFSEFSQFTIEQMPMSNKLCLAEDRGKSYKKWGFEKLVYKDSKQGIRRDRKYVVRPRDVFATGVHMSQNMVGKTTHKTEGKIMYYHYHGTISERREPCRQLINATQINFERTPFVVDTTMRDAAGAVKRFELKMIGSTLQRTRQ